MSWWITSSTASSLVPGRVSSFYINQGHPPSPEVAAAARRIEAAALAENPWLANITPRTVHILGNAFNAGAEFTSFYAATAIVGDVVAAKPAGEYKGREQINKDDDKTRPHAYHYSKKRSVAEHADQVAAAVQGWPKVGGFGVFVYNFLKDEINDHGGEASVGKHAFYVYNPTTSANVVFREKVRNHHLPASFGGFSSDLEGIFHLMWANRQIMRATMPRHKADAVVFHLLVPTMGAVVVPDRLAISESIGRLVIKGHMENGRCQAWFNFVHMPEHVTLNGIRNLNTDANKLTEGQSRAIFEFAAACGWAVALYCVFWSGIWGFGVLLWLPWLHGLARRPISWWCQYVPPRLLGRAPYDSGEIVAQRIYRGDYEYE